MAPRRKSTRSVPTPVADLVTARTRRWRLLHLQRLQQIRRAWVKAAGPYVAANVQPVRLVRKTLRLAVSDSSWAQEMRYLAEPILERLQPLLPGRWVEQLKVVAGEPFPDLPLPEPGPTPKLVEATAAMRERVEQACRHIADPELAAAVGRAMLTFLRLDGARKPGLDRQKADSPQEEP